MTIAAQPELGEVWITAIVRLEIDLKEVNWVKDGWAFFKDHHWSFKEMVGFVHWEEEWHMRTGSIIEFDRQAANGFVVVSKAGGIVIDEFTQPQEAVPAHKHDSIEEEVIVGSAMQG